MVTAHDDLFRCTFRHEHIAATWLRSILPTAIVASIDWSTLALASDRASGLRLRAHVADLVFTALRHDSTDLVVLVVGHKAYADPDLREQLLRYCVHLRRVARRRGDAPVLVVPVVLHHAERPLVQVTGADTDPPADAFTALQPQLQFVLDDLSRCTEAELRRPNYPPLAQLTLLCLAFARRLTNEDLLAAIDRWGDLLAAVECSIQLSN